MFTTFVGYLMRLFLFEQMVRLAMWLYGGRSAGTWNDDPVFVFIITCVFGVPLYVLAVVVFAIGSATRPGELAHPSDETRCRCCNAVLRNLSVPKCPVCGEAI